MPSSVKFQSLSDTGIGDLTIAGYAGAADDLVLHVEVEGTVFDDEREEVCDVA